MVTSRTRPRSPNCSRPSPCRPSTAICRFSALCGAAPPNGRSSTPPKSTRGSSSSWPHQPDRDGSARREKLTAKLLKKAKLAGLSDLQIAHLRNLGDEGENTIRELRWTYGLRPVYKTVDTCAAEFDAVTPYYYSCYADETELRKRDREAVIILGSGPNRIGQGIEFDYTCVHAVQELGKDYDTIMVNCNPETVSTDYDMSNRLYFEPLTFEDVLEIYEAEKKMGPVKGVIVQLGGQTPLSLAARLKPPACRSWAPPRSPSTWPRTASCSVRCCAAST